MFKFLDDKSQTAAKALSSAEDITTKRTLRATCEFKLGDKSCSPAEFCGEQAGGRGGEGGGAKRRNKYENTANRRNNMKIGITRKRSGKTRKREETRINERTKGEALGGLFSQLKSPLYTINYIVIKSRCSRTPNRLTETTAAAAAFFQFAIPEGDERTD